MALLLLALAVLAWAIFQQSATLLPRAFGPNETYKQILNPAHLTTLANRHNQAYHALRRKLPVHAGGYHDPRSRTAAQQKLALQVPPRRRAAPTFRDGLPIRAGFYVNWDAQSLNTLRRQVGKMNMVLPEWLFVPNEAGELSMDIDTAALALLHRHPGVAVVPMISNYYQEKWNGGNVRRMIATEQTRQRFIANVLKAVRRYGFAGVNIDFESLNLDDPTPLETFQRELYAALHGAGYLVTQDIAPLNDDYDPAKLARANDYLILMAYDQHETGSGPGPVAAHKWGEDILTKMEAQVDPRQLVLGLAAYGYDWRTDGGTKHIEGVDVTYQEALTTAKESEGKVHFDDDTYNLDFSYADENDHPHQVFFTDAASNFNAMRAADDQGLAGVAVWRLGSEDPRLWTFFNHDLRADSLRRSGPALLQRLRQPVGSTDVDYIGEGEVLDILSGPQDGRLTVSLDPQDQLISEETYTQLPTSYVVRKFGLAPKTIVLTFDDGPDETYTPQVINILKQEKVPATFFVVGENAENNVPLLRQLYEDGYEIGNHTFTHPNIAEVSPGRARLELNATRRLIECVTGHSTILFRPPYNADAEPQNLQEIEPIMLAKQENYLTVGESIDPQDWREGVTPDQIFNQVVKEQNNGSVILLHDAGGNREATVAALPRIIHYFKQKGFRFITVAELMHKPKSELMPALANDRDRNLAQANWATVQGLYFLEHGLYTLLLLGILLTVGRQVVIAGLAWWQHRRTQAREAAAPVPPAETEGHWPRLSIIVPAYNEEVNAVRSLESLLRLDYPDFEVVFVDDGSKDATHALVAAAFAGHAQVRVLTKPNGGKASARNYGNAHADSDFMVCIDADTQLDPAALRHLMSRFDSAQVGAVAGNVKVGNERNLLTRWQAIEYITSQNFDRRAFELLGCITVVPGAIGAFRREALRLAGGFTTDTLAEDCDLTIRLQRVGYTITYAPRAVAVTEAPETVGMFLKQRFRWSFGIMQSFWKHRDLCFNPRYGTLGLVAFPNLLLFQLILPFLNPIADVLMVYSLVSGQGGPVLGYYLAFLAVDAAAAALAFGFEGERRSRLWWLLPQRFAYRQLMYVVLVRSVLRAVKGELQSWGVLQRTGNVTLPTDAPPARQPELTR
ncbi:MAG: glycosyltransferase [Hymenobacter sp.]